MKIFNTRSKWLKLLFWAFSLMVLAGLALFAFEYYIFGKSSAVRLGRLQAFTEQASYERGAAIPVFVHTDSDLKGTVYHIKDSLVVTDISISASKTIQNSLFDPDLGFDWEPTFTLDSRGLASGYYVLKLENKNKGSFDLVFLIRPTLPKAVAIVASTNTWQAYNYFGGLSNYKAKGVLIKQIRRLSRYFGWNFLNIKLPNKKPYVRLETRVNLEGSLNDQYHSQEILRTELPLVHFLHKREVEYSVYGDFDFAFDPHILESKLIIFHSHSEYWSREMIDRLQKYLENGGKVAFLSGNNIFREVEFGGSNLQMIDQKTDGEMVRKLIGTYYSRKGYKTYAPFEVKMPEHWVFKGEDLSIGDSFARYSSNMGKGGSGLEMDVTGEGSDGFDILAQGLNKNDPAEMVIKETARGGWVFNASSVVFAGCLSHDKTVDRVLENLIKDVVH